MINMMLHIIKIHLLKIRLLRIHLWQVLVRIAVRTKSKLALQEQLTQSVGGLEYVVIKDDDFTASLFNDVFNELEFEREFERESLCEGKTHTKLSPPPSHSSFSLPAAALLLVVSCVERAELYLFVVAILAIGHGGRSSLRERRRPL